MDGEGTRPDAPSMLGGVSAAHCSSPFTRGRRSTASYDRPEKSNHGHEERGVPTAADHEGTQSDAPSMLGGVRVARRNSPFTLGWRSTPSHGCPEKSSHRRRYRLFRHPIGRQPHPSNKPRLARHSRRPSEHFHRLRTRTITRIHSAAAQQALNLGFFHYTSSKAEFYSSPYHRAN